MDKTFFLLGAALAALSVALGAFGAHGLRQAISPDLLANYETGARYQMYHALALLAVAWAIGRWPGGTLLPLGGWLFVAGVVLFSGSLYLMAFTGWRWLGAITPLGGVAFIGGWALMIYHVWTTTNH